MGTYVGTGGFPIRDMTVVLQGAQKTPAGVVVKGEYHNAEGDSGPLEGTLDGQLLRVAYRQFRCELVFDDAWSQFRGDCVEQLQAEARAPIQFTWTGARPPPPPKGRYVGKGGFPSREVTMTLADGVMRYRFSGGEKGKTPMRMNGRTGQFAYKRFRCEVVFEETNTSFSGTCSEDIGAQARTPVTFPWTGKR